MSEGHLAQRRNLGPVQQTQVGEEEEAQEPEEEQEPEEQQE